MHPNLDSGFMPRLNLFEQAVWMARLNAGRRLRSENRVGTRGENLRVLVAESDGTRAETIIMSSRDMNILMQNRNDLVLMHNSALEPVAV